MSTVREVFEKDESEGIKLFEKEIEPLGLSKGAKDKLIAMFTSAFSKKSAADCMVDWKYVIPLTDAQQIPYETLKEPENPKSILEKLIVVKLNGGLGTTMGCTGPKSLIECTKGRSFFDIVIGQLKELNAKYGTDVPLVLMNSFNTDELMKPHVDAIKGLKIYTFNQNKFPRIYTDTLEPVPKDANSPIDMWSPPGHADVYHCLRDSGLLDKFLNEGKKYMMISNFDNMGATVDLKVLNKAIAENRSYIAETVLKTPDEWKGGMPIMYKGHMKLLETAIVPKEHFNDYTNMNFLNYFHANNLWINLETLKKALDENTLKIDTMRNYKQYNGRQIVQLESACGSAIQSFPDSCAVRVPRYRFMPVKSCNELLLDRGDVYILEGSHFIRNPKRSIPELPSILLSSEYQHVSEFEKRFPEAPSMLELKKLVINGDVWFGKNITIAGNVSFEIPKGEKLVVPDGITIKDKTIHSAADL